MFTCKCIAAILACKTIKNQHMNKTGPLSLLTLLLFSATVSFGQLSNGDIHDLKTGRARDLVSPVYWLPYKNGSRHLFVQGANSSFSHQHELSFDFKMGIGSTICAAREGVVIEIKEDSDQGWKVHSRIRSASPVSRARLIGKNPEQLEGQHTATICGECVVLHTQSTSLF